MYTYHCALVFSYLFELLPAGAVCREMHAVRLVRVWEPPGSEGDELAFIYVF
jgi:hypothetical protein